MSKILKRTYYNNGYGCSCCRQDWEDTEWIDEEELPSVEDFFNHDLKIFDGNVDRGGEVGVTYEKDGEILFGITPDIYRAAWYFYATWGNCDFPIEIKIQEDREWGKVTYHTEEIIAKYKKYLSEKE